MKFYYHEKKNSVATCQNCGKGLCKECASKTTPCMCDDCIKLYELQKQEEKKKKKEEALIDTTSEFIVAIIKGVLFVVAMNIISKGFESDIFTFKETLVFFFVPFGWSMLTYLEQFMPPVFLSGLLYIIYIVFKLAAAMFLGLFCFIYQVVKFIIKIVYHSKKK